MNEKMSQYILHSITTRIHTDHKQRQTCLCWCEFKNNNDNKSIIGIGQTGSKDVDLTEEMLHRRIAPAVLGIPLTFTFDRISQRSGKTIMSPLMELVMCFELNYKMHGVLLTKAVCAIDSCMWDALAKLNRQPCWQIMRTSLLFNKTDNPPRLAIYASSIGRGSNMITILEKECVRLNQKHGIKSFKLKVGERMGGVRRGLFNNNNNIINESTTYGVYGNTSNADLLLDSVLKATSYDSTIRFAFDCNGGFAHDEDIQSHLSQSFLQRIWFLEEVFPWFINKRPSISKALHGINVLIAGGEQEFRADVFEQNVKDQLFDIIQPDIGYCGGPSVALLISEFIRHHYPDQIKFLPHSPSADLTFIMTAHVLMAQYQPGNNQKIDIVDMEMACVRDGYQQVELNESTGEFCPHFCSSTSTWKVQNGYFYPPQNICHGWDVEILSETQFLSHTITPERVSVLGGTNASTGQRSGL
jgi:L-alanine-DL-glutamate epimerase-like enolase superfamily enzyme